MSAVNVAGTKTDKLINTLDAIVFAGSAFNDTIENSGDSVTISAGDGNDYIYNGGTNVSINTDGGSDTIFSGSSNVTINAGDGDNSIHNDASSATITAGDGSDSIVNSGSNVSIDAGNGDDTIYNSYGAANVTIDSGDGDDFIGNSGNNVTITAGEGSDTIKVSRSAVKSFTVTDFSAGDVIELFTAVNAIDIVDGALVAGDLTISGITSTAGENDIWLVDDTQATLTRANSGGAKLSDDGKTITFEAGTDDEEELFVISGLKDGVTVDELQANVTVEGTTVTVNEKVLSTDTVTISNDYTLALADDVPRPETVSADWDINSAGDTTTAIYVSGGTTAGYILDDGKIVHVDANDVATFTLTGLSKTFAADNVTVDGNKVILSAAALGKATVKLTTDGDFALELDENCSTVGNVAKSWTLDGTTATLHDAGKSDGYTLTNAKTVTYTPAVVGKTLLTVSGVKDGLSEDDLNENVTVSGKTLTVTPDVDGHA